MTVFKLLFGKHQQDYALIAVIAGAIGAVLYHLDVVSEAQYTQSLAGYIMMYFASTVSWLAYRKNSPQGHREENSLISTFWRFVRIPYWMTVFITIVYFVELNPQIGRVLIYSGYLTLACALASVLAWFLRGRHTAS